MSENVERAIDDYFDMYARAVGWHKRGNTSMSVIIDEAEAVYEKWARYLWRTQRTLPPLRMDKAVATIQGRPWP